MPDDALIRALRPKAKELRDRATMNILTCQEPYPDVTKKIVRQLLSALEEAERAAEQIRAAFVAHLIECPQCHERIHDSRIANTKG